MSIAGGVINSAIGSRKKRYTAFQIFTAGSRSWRQNAPEKGDAAIFLEYIKKYDLLPIAHIPYLCNLASPNEEVFRNSKEMLRSNISNCNLLGIRYLVMHLGSHLGRGSDFGVGRITESIRGVKDSLGKLTLLLENTSGYKNSIGSRFDEIGKVMNGIKSKNMGICFDTCHAFAAGYDIRKKEIVDKLAEEIDLHIGSDRMKLIHLNDSKFDMGSTKDRHWHLGKGYIGMEGFKSLLRNGTFRNNDFIMETPENEEGDDTYNLRAFRSIMDNVDAAKISDER